MPADHKHAECVDRLLSRAKREGQGDPLRLLELATSAVWRQVSPTLGPITLSAIVARVHSTAEEQYAVLAGLRVSEDGVSLDGPVGRSADAEARDAVRFFLVELLTVVGNLTAEILTPAIHAILSGMNLRDDAAQRTRKGADR